MKKYKEKKYIVIKIIIRKKERKYIKKINEGGKLRIKDKKKYIDITVF